MPRKAKPLTEEEILAEAEEWLRWVADKQRTHPEWQPPLLLTRYCQMLVSRKIATNIREMREKQRWKNRKQAIAVSYSQVRKRSPRCAPILVKK